ncbi:MAG TPA: class I SAM-dependent methyltransferase [Thermohalobaculum sp.]|nr:class I SAM-dependent methyltransferase [Thermohalobaculum sp.]
MSLIPPLEVIDANRIGIHDRENVIAEYNKISTFMFNVLKGRAGLKETSDVLDVGCGTGRVAMPLTRFLTTGSYTGIDIVKSSIDWCQEAFRDFPNFRFVHADLYSEYYNPEATLKAGDYEFPFDDDSFDLIWSSSLFTHMLIDDVDTYLSEMSRTIRRGGRIWNSYLLLDEISEPLVLGPRNDGRRMQYEVDGGRIGWKDKPEWVVGLRLDRIKALHQRHGFEITDLQLSDWSGGRPETPYKGQDFIVARKA